MPVNTQNTWAAQAPQPPRHRERDSDSDSATRHTIPEDDELSDMSFDEGDEVLPVEVPVPIPMSDTHDDTPEVHPDPVVRWVDQQPHQRHGVDTNPRGYANYRPRRSMVYPPTETPLTALYMNRNSRIAAEPLRSQQREPRSPRTWISQAGPPQYPHYPRHPRYTSHQPRTYPRTYQDYGPEPVDLRRSSTDAELLRALNVRSAVDLSVHQYSNPYQRYVPVPPARASDSNNRISSVRDTSNPIARATETPPGPSIFTHDSSHIASQSTSTAYTQTLNSQMTSLLSERRAMGALYDEHMHQKSNNKRKRTFREVIGQMETDPYEKYKFHIIRPRPCVFLKSGLSFDYEGIMKVNIVNVGENLDTFTGFFEFDDQPSLKYWLKTHTPRCSSQEKLREDQSTLSFTARLVDFEDNDLRFQGIISERYPNIRYQAPRTPYEQYLEAAAYAKEPHGLHSCLIWSQIDLWKALPPFENVGRDMIQSIMVCTDCLTDLQKSYALFKMSFEGSCTPDMIGSLNRSTGEMSLVATQDRIGSGTLAMQMIDVGRSTIGKPRSCPRVMLSACSKRYSLDSVAIS